MVDPEKTDFSFKTTSLFHTAKIMYTVTHRSSLLASQRGVPHVNQVMPGITGNQLLS